MKSKRKWQRVWKRWRIWQLIGMAIATCAFIVSCTTAPLQPLRISCTLWLGYEPLLLARDLGYFGDTPIQIVEADDHTTSLKRFTNGDMEMVTATLDVTLENATLQDDVRTFLVMDISEGADTLIVQPEIETLRELRGKRIGVLPATFSKLVLIRALESVNLTPEDVTIIVLDTSQQEAAFVKREIDALVAFDPVLAKLQTKGAKILFDSSQMPGEIIDLLVGRENLPTTHEQQLQVILAGWFQALDYMETHPDDAIARIAEREGLTPEQVKRGLSQIKYPSLEENLAMLNKTDTTSIDGMNKLSQFLKDQGILDTVVDPEKLLDPNPLNKL